MLIEKRIMWLILQAATFHAATVISIGGECVFGDGIDKYARSSLFLPVHLQLQHCISSILLPGLASEKRAIRFIYLYAHSVSCKFGCYVFPFYLAQVAMYGDDSCAVSNGPST